MLQVVKKTHADQAPLLYFIVGTTGLGGCLGYETQCKAAETCHVRHHRHPRSLDTFDFGAFCATLTSGSLPIADRPLHCAPCLGFHSTQSCSKVFCAPPFHLSLLQHSVHTSLWATSNIEMDAWVTLQLSFLRQACFHELMHDLTQLFMSNHWR